jgi:hypothetical protein
MQFPTGSTRLLSWAGLERTDWAEIRQPTSKATGNTFPEPLFHGIYCLLEAETQSLDTCQGPCSNNVWINTEYSMLETWRCWPANCLHANWRVSPDWATSPCKPQGPKIDQFKRWATWPELLLKPKYGFDCWVVECRHSTVWREGGIRLAGSLFWTITLVWKMIFCWAPTRVETPKYLQKCELLVRPWCTHCRLPPCSLVHGIKHWQIEVLYSHAVSSGMR